MNVGHQLHYVYVGYVISTIALIQDVPFRVPEVDVQWKDVPTESAKLVPDHIETVPNPVLISDSTGVSAPTSALEIT